VKLALGTVQFGLPYGIANSAGQVGQDDAREMLAFAWRNGIDTIDTAIAYGESEERLGQIGIGDFAVVTKVPGLPSDMRDPAAWIRAQVRASLDRLKVPQLYGLLLHRAADLLGPQGDAVREGLKDVKAAGWTHKIGISAYSPVEIDAVMARLPIDLVQAPLNLVDRRLEASGCLLRLRDRGVEVHVRSAFLQGLLLMSEAAIPPKFERWAGLLGRWHAWLRESGVSALSACLAYPLSLPGVSKVIVGADGLRQLEQITAAAQVPLVQPPDITCTDEDLINPSRWNLQ
jgi:aryl-alcohol dehydrogenase-like predicted oxidoreductase